jgi:hypothetical protein
LQSTDRDDFGLLRLDLLGQRDQLRANAEEAIAALMPGLRPDATRDATDESDSARVTVDLRGKVLDVRIGPRWRDRLAPNQLGAAVFQAYGRAREKAVAAQALLAMDEREAQGTPSAPADASLPFTDPGFLDWAEEEIEHHARRRRAPATGTEQLVSGPAALVRLEVRDQQVVGVRINISRAAVPAADRLAADARDAFGAVSQMFQAE